MRPISDALLSLNTIPTCGGTKPNQTDDIRNQTPDLLLVPHSKLRQLPTLNDPLLVPLEQNPDKHLGQAIHLDRLVQLTSQLRCNACAGRENARRPAAVDLEALRLVGVGEFAEG